MRLWHAIEDLVGADCGFKASGQVAVAVDEAEWDELKAREAEVRALGWTHEELIGPDELYALLPALVPGCLGGLVARDDGFASPYHTTMAFRAAALRAGARIIEGVRATAFRRSAGAWRVETSAGAIAARVLVNTGGAWGGTIAAALGEPVPLTPTAPMMMVTAPVAPFCEPVVLGVQRALSFKQAQNGSVLIGGGHLGQPDTSAETSSVDLNKLVVSAATVAALFPLLRDVPLVRTWSGIESRMPDGIPVIGPSGTEPDAFHAFGFSHHGFQLGPVVGRILADLVLDGACDLPLAPFRIGRFSQRAAAA